MNAAHAHLQEPIDLFSYVQVIYMILVHKKA